MIPGPKTSTFSCERSRKGKDRGMALCMVTRA